MSPTILMYDSSAMRGQVFTEAQRFTARGYGETNPIDDAPRELQTRVEFWRTDHPDCAINP